MLRKEEARNRRSQARTVVISPQRVPMPRGALLRSRVKGNFQARFWSSGGRGDSPTDCRKLSELRNSAVYSSFVSTEDSFSWWGVDGSAHSWAGLQRPTNSWCPGRGGSRIRVAVGRLGLCVSPLPPHLTSYRSLSSSLSRVNTG
jgi:hypothetical protein